MHRVLLTEASYKNCRGAIEKALSTFPLPVRGKKVMVKVNAVGGAEPEQAMVTHPSVLRALITLLEEMGAGEIVVGDNPGVTYYGRNLAAFTETGLLEAAGRYYCNIGKEARAVPFDPQFIKSVFPSRAILDADIYISVPKFKTHARAGISVALKNNFGILPGGQKSNLHHRAPKPIDFGRMLMEVFQVRPPDLTIVDAVLGAQGIGPYSLDLVYMGLIMASDNAVALDATVARMMGYDPMDVPIVRFAQEAGLGSVREEDIEIIGNVQPISGYTRPAVEDITTTELMTFSGRMAEVPSYRPKVDAAKCDGCRLCADGCPAGALTMSGNLPSLDTSICVPCFCCKEVCPREAIVLGLPE